MGIVTKFVGVVFPTLVGFGVLSQVPIQGPGTNSGSRTTAAAELNETLHYFLKTARDPRVREGVFACYGVSPDQFKNLTMKITDRMISKSFDHDPNKALRTLGKEIQSVVEEELVKSELASVSKSLKERLTFQAMYDWVRTHYKYNVFLETAHIDIQRRFWSFESVYAMADPVANCVAFTFTLNALGNSVGLDCFPVNGFARRHFDSGRLPSDELKTWHKWSVLRQSDGLLVPFDPTNSIVELQLARKLGGSKVVAAACSPVALEDYAIHNAVYYASAVSGNKAALNSEDKVTRLTYIEWRKVDIAFMKGRYAREVGMEHFNSAAVNIPFK